MPSVARPGARLIVWRHGETTHNASGTWQGQLDIPLSPVGIAQATAAAPAIADRHPDLLVSSDLLRAAQTADVLAERLGVSVVRDPRFREIHVGDWQGKTAAQVKAAYPEDAERLLTGEDFRRGGSGENVAEVAERALAGVQDVIARLGDTGLGVVATHGVTARILVAALCDIAQAQAWRTLATLRNCHWAELACMPSGGWRIEAWNVGVTSAAPVPAQA